MTTQHGPRLVTPDDKTKGPSLVSYLSCMPCRYRTVKMSGPICGWNHKRLDNDAFMAAPEWCPLMPKEESDEQADA